MVNPWLESDHTGYTEISIQDFPGYLKKVSPLGSFLTITLFPPGRIVKLKFQYIDLCLSAVLRGADNWRSARVAVADRGGEFGRSNSASSKRW